MTWLLVGAALWLSVNWAFVAVMHAKAVLKREGLSLYWRVMLLPLAAAAVLLDVAFNLTFGTLMFVELPRELLFTSRCQRHYREGDGRRKRVASFWARQLNTFDRDHVS